jgi:genome maintenance exonuclease 1
LKTRTGKNGTGRYYVVDERSGLALPSVTTIISETSDKSGLIEWQKRVGEAEAARVSKFSANRGTFMHSLHEHYLNCKFIEKIENSLQETFKRALSECSSLTKEEIECGKDLFLQFHNNSNFYDDIGEVLFQEVPVWSLKGGGYAGRLDLSIAGMPKIIDFKTAKKPKKKEWIEGYFKQIAAYSVAMFERYGIFPEQCEIWISCETGDVQTFIVTKEEIKHWFNEFYKCVKQYHELHPQN